MRFKELTLKGFYLYLFAIIGLLMLIIGVTRGIDMAIKHHIFSAKQELHLRASSDTAKLGAGISKELPSRRPMGNLLKDKLDTEKLSKLPGGAEGLETSKSLIRPSGKFGHFRWHGHAYKKHSSTSFIPLIIVGILLWGSHWYLIRRERI